MPIAPNAQLMSIVHSKFNKVTRTKGDVALMRDARKRMVSCTKDLAHDEDGRCVSESTGRQLQAFYVARQAQVSCVDETESKPMRLRVG